MILTFISCAFLMMRAFFLAERLAAISAQNFLLFISRTSMSSKFLTRNFLNPLGSWCLVFFVVSEPDLCHARHSAVPPTDGVVDSPWPPPTAADPLETLSSLKRHRKWTSKSLTPKEKSKLKKKNQKKHERHYEFTFFLFL